MKIFYFIIVLMALSSCRVTKPGVAKMNAGYTPDDKNLYDTIVKLDSLFFDAYNSCKLDLDKYASFYSQDIEFYHDKGGFMNSKKDIIEATKNNVCGKVTRTLVAGTIEAYL